MSFNSKYTGAQVEELLDKIPTANDVWHTGNFNPANYLSLEGGKLKKSVQTVLTLDAQAMGNQNYLGFVNGQTDLGKIGFSNIDIPVFRNSSNVNYKLWHEGNDGDGSGLDADLLDGLQSTDFARSYKAASVDKSLVGIGYDNKSMGSVNLPTAGGFISATQGKYGFQLLGEFSGTSLFFRGVNNGAFGNWRNIAFTNSNVASATKLQTARTIWGQSFDGSGNIEGNILLQIGASSYNVGPKAYFAIAGRGSVGSIQGLYTGVDWNASSNYAKGALVFQTYNSDTINDAMFINYLGNVGIGTTNPTTKLDVAGSIHSSGSITQDSDINLKDKIKDVLLSINEIAEAPLFEFTYKSDKDKRIHVGTSAQYWIEKNNWFCKKQDNGYYDMEIQNLALASAISIAKEFKKYKEETESTISSMKKEIEELKQIVLNMNK